LAFSDGLTSCLEKSLQDLTTEGRAWYIPEMIKTPKIPTTKLYSQAYGHIEVPFLQKNKSRNLVYMNALGELCWIENNSLDHAKCGHLIVSEEGGELNLKFQMEILTYMDDYLQLHDFKAPLSLRIEDTKPTLYYYKFTSNFERLDCVKLWNVQKMSLNDNKKVTFGFKIDQNVFIAIIRYDQERYYVIFGKVDLSSNLMLGYWFYRTTGNFASNNGQHTGKWGKLVAEYYEKIDDFVPKAYKDLKQSVKKSEVKIVSYNIRIMLTHKYCNQDNLDCYKTEIFA